MENNIIHLLRQAEYWLNHKHEVITSLVAQRQLLDIAAVFIAQNASMQPASGGAE